MKKEIALALALIALAISTRLLPHWPNFTALGAAALFSGAFYKRKALAFIIPLGALFLSDLIINNIIYGAFYSGFQFLSEGFYFMYLGIILTILVGSYASISKEKPQNVALAAISSTLLFYLVTNFGAWLANPMYTQDFFGLINSYVAGLPFLMNGTAASLVYSYGIFGAYWYFAKSSATANSSI
tara:strand:- start:5888 stop:6442 length:555 start_codon:yes stop_codon:yes gene_type:complete